MGIEDVPYALAECLDRAQNLSDIPRPLKPLKASASLAQQELSIKLEPTLKSSWRQILKHNGRAIMIGRAIR